MALALEEDGSVFDILYADERRIASLLSQMGDDGILTELTRLTEASSGASRGLDIKVAKIDTKDGESKSLSRTFDPRWLVPLLFLDRAKERIVRDIASASIWNLILASGRLIVTDVSILKEIWTSPAMKKHMLKEMSGQDSADQQAGNRHDRRSSNKPRPRQDTTQQEAILEFLPHIPHSPQINIVDDEDNAFWATIDPSYLVGTVQDLMLKHGAKVAGRWSVVGVYDARPFREDDHGFIDASDLIAIGALQESIWKVALDLANPVRQAMGRPFLSHGITPLLIFREIG